MRKEIVRAVSPGKKEPASLKLSSTQLEALKPAVEASKGYVEQARSQNTKRSYRIAVKNYLLWLKKKGLPKEPPLAPVLCLYFSDAAQNGYAVATLSVWRVAIANYYRSLGYEDPPTGHSMVKTNIAGIRRTVGVKQVQKAPITIERLEQIVAGLSEDLRSVRDRALLLVGFSGAFRRSELTALEVSDLEFVDQGMRVTIRRSKTDQEQVGRSIAMVRVNTPTCPVKAMEVWLAKSQITEGPLFRWVTRYGTVKSKALCDRSVANIVKKYARQIGLDASDFGGHSLRAGFVTSAADNSVGYGKIKEVTGHKSPAMIERYIREADLFKNSALEQIHKRGKK